MVLVPTQRDDSVRLYLHLHAAGCQTDVAVRALRCHGSFSYFALPWRAQEVILADIFKGRNRSGSSR